MSGTMTWNYRVVKFDQTDYDLPPWYSICEVFYEDGEVISHTDDGIDVGGESIEELRTQLKILLIAYIGGAAIYQQFIKRADKMFLTTIDKECEGDTYFPNFKPELWHIENTTEYNDPEGYMLDNPNQLGLNYTLEEYEREF